MVSFNSQLLVGYAAVTNDSQMSVAYKTKVYFPHSMLTSACLRSDLWVGFLHSRVQMEGTVPFLNWVMGGQRDNTDVEPHGNY